MKKAIVFGASSGIGKVLVEYLIGDGYQVAVTGRRLSLLQELQQQHPQSIFPFQNDIQDIQETEDTFKKIMEAFKMVHLVIHSSGIGHENPTLNWEEEYDTIKTNVIGGTLIYDLVFKQFKEQGFGHLVSITSIASLRGNRHAPAYYASKAYQVNYLESLYLKAKEIPGGNVYITDVRPGFVDTRMALGDGIFWMAPLEKASRQIYSAIKRKKRKVYITRRWNLIAWVLHLVPSWLMKKVM